MLAKKEAVILASSPCCMIIALGVCVSVMRIKCASEGGVPCVFKSQEYEVWMEGGKRVLRPA